MTENKATMTPDQRKMARHALGLDDYHVVSYRNRYYAGPGTTQETAWDDLVSKGFAERTERIGVASVVGFCLTAEGAAAVLKRGERLDPEDFPVVVGSRS